MSAKMIKLPIVASAGAQGVAVPKETHESKLDNFFEATINLVKMRNIRPVFFQARVAACELYRLHLMATEGEDAMHEAQGAITAWLYSTPPRL